MRSPLLWFALTSALLAAACTGRPVVGGDAATVADVGPVDTGPEVNVSACATSADCDDNVPCTVDECGPRGCTHRPVDAMCADDGQACTVERCVAGRGCVSEPDNSRCDDMVACTVDLCEPSRGCTSIADNSRCPSGQLCRADMMGCFAPPRCSAPGDPRCDDGQPCTVDSCDMATGQCRYENRDAMCDDGMFCNGAERCVPFRGCLPTPGPRCDDGVPCTIDQCNEAMRRCDHLPEHRLCNDGRFCNGAEQCDATMGCRPGTAPACNDMNACTVDACDDALNRCTNNPRDADGDGDPDRACGGGDCNDMDRAVNSRAMEACNGRDDNCNGMTDEGVLSECGNCDATCRRRTVGAGGTPFTSEGRRGTEVDPSRMGLVVRAETSVADYLWVPNVAESTLSRWDATTAREVGRYRVGLPSGECRGSCCHTAGCNMPSRVAVDGNGDAYVANRGFGMQGTVTKIAADRRDCVDRNGNGVIDTSTSNVPLAWGADECVLWTVPVARVDAVLRSMTVDVGDAMFPQGYPWVGTCNAAPFQLFQLNPRTGAVLRTVTMPHCVYGAVVLRDGTLWAHGPSDRITAVNTRTGAVGPSVPVLNRAGCASSYGITADARGRIWLSGRTCRDAVAFDTNTGQWSRIDLSSIVPPGGGVGLGITVDASNRIWVPISRSADWEGPVSVAWWNADAFVANATIPSFVARSSDAPAGLTHAAPIGADRIGNIWVGLVAPASPLLRYNPSTGVWSQFVGPNRVYTYTDFTGSVRRTIIGQGTYTDDFDAGCAAPVFSELTWDVEAPTGTAVSFSASTAATSGGLAMAMANEIAQAPRDTPPVNISSALMARGVSSQRFLRMAITLRGSAGGESPALRSFRVSWNCP